MANVIKFTLKTKDLASKAMGKMAGTVGRISRALKRVAKVGRAAAMAVASVAKTVAKIAAAALVAAGVIFRLAKSIANVQDEAGKMALKLGRSVENLTRMQFAAKLSGIRITTFNMAIQRMQRRLGEAAKGTGEALGALRDLGIQAKSFVKLPLDTQLEILADKFKNMEDGSEALRTAFKLFDSEGVVMLQLLKKGSPAMQAMANEAERFGLVVSAQAAANAEKFNDRIVMLNGAVEGASRSIGNALIPMLTGLAEKLTAFVANNKDKVVKFFDNMTLGAVTFGIIAGDMFDEIKDTIKNMFGKGGFKKFAESAKTALILILTMINPFAVSLGRVLLAGFKIIWDGFLAGATTAMGLIISSGASWITGFGKLVISGFKVIWDGFLSLGRGAFTALKNIFSDDPAPDLLTTIFGNLKRDTAKARANMGTLFDDLKGQTVGNLGSVFDGITAGSSEAVTGFKASISAMTTEAKAVAGVVAESTGGMMDSVIISAGVRAKAMLDSIKSTGDAINALQNDQQASAITFMTSFRGLYMDFMTANRSIAEQMAAQVNNILLSSISGLGDAIGNSIIMGQNLMQSLVAVAQQVASSIISMLVQIGVQRLIAAAIGKKGSAIEGASELGVKSAIAYANGFNASSALGIVGLAAAPAVGAAASATMLSGASASGAAGSGVGSAIATIAHGGLDYVPSEQTALLDQGERIVSPNQNRDLTSFLENGGGPAGGGAVTIENISILPNATNADSFLAMSSAELRRVVEDKIIPALDDLNLSGVRPTEPNV